MIEIVSEIHTKGKTTICEALYDGAEVYAIFHAGYGKYLIFDHDDKVLGKIIQRLNKSRMDCNLLRNRAKVDFVFLFTKSEREKQISVRTYLYAAYHNLPIVKVRGQNIELYKIAEKNVMDCRKANLFYAGGRNTDGFSIVERPCHEGEKYLLFSKDGRTEVMSYSDALYNLLTMRCYCSTYTYNNKNRMILAYVYGKGSGHKETMNLCKLICYFNSFWKKYEKQIGAQKRFVHAYPTMRKECKDLSAAHINSINWNNCNGNLLFMDKESNRNMSDYIARFIGEYEAFPFSVNVDGKDIILCRVTAYGKDLYYAIESVKDYVDFQKTLLGKTKLTESLNIFELSRGSARQIDTPAQASKAYERQQNPQSVEQALPLLWDWCDKRDTLLKKYEESPDSFIVWKNTDGKGLNATDLFNCVMPLFLAWNQS